MARDIRFIRCSCGGDYKDDSVKAEEAKDYGCDRDQNPIDYGGCCVGAMVCDKCDNRLTIVYEAPDW